MKVHLGKPKPPPSEGRSRQKARLGFLDASLVGFLIFAVGHQTPLGRLPGYLYDLSQGETPTAPWSQKNHAHGLGPLELSSAHNSPSGPLPTGLLQASERLGVEAEFLGSIAFTLGSCDSFGCQIPAPPYLSEVLGTLPTSPVVPIHTLAKGIKAAANQLHGNQELALEALFVGVANVRRAIHFSRIAGQPDPGSIEQHLGYFPSYVPQGSVETLRSVLANHLLWGLHWPVPGTQEISSKFGMRTHPVTRRSHLHNGVDIPAKIGTAVVAAQSGQVSIAGRDALNGNYLKVNHGFGIETVYCHLDSLVVGSGHKINKGSLVGHVGETGRVTGPHLHFTLKLNNEPVNPSKYAWKKHPEKQRLGLLPN